MRIARPLAAAALTLGLAATLTPAQAATQPTDAPAAAHLTATAAKKAPSKLTIGVSTTHIALGKVVAGTKLTRSGKPYPKQTVYLVDHFAGGFSRIGKPVKTDRNGKAKQIISFDRVGRHCLSWRYDGNKTTKAAQSPTKCVTMTVQPRR